MLTPIHQRVLASDPRLPLLAALPALLALMALLTDSSSDAVLSLLGILCFAVSCYCTVRTYLNMGIRAQLPSLVIHLAFMFWFFAPTFLRVIRAEGFDDRAAAISADSANALSTFVAVTLTYFVTILFGQLRLSHRLARRITRTLGSEPFVLNRHSLLFVLGGTLASLGFYVAIAGGFRSALSLISSSRATDKPWEHVGYTASSLTPLHVFFTSLLVALAVVSLHLALSSGASIRARIYLVANGIVAAGWVSIGSGTRSLLIQATLPALLVFFAGAVAQRSAQRYVRLGLLGALLLATILVASIQRHYRSTATLQDGATLAIEDNDMFKLCSFAIAVQEREQRYIHDSALLHIVSGPVPRALWPNKPMMESMFVFTRYVWGFDTRDRGGNTLPSIVGQYYLNWGWWGIIELGLFLGLITRLLDQAYALAHSRSLARVGLVAIMTYLFVSFRMLSFSYFSPMLMTLVIAAALGRVTWFHAKRSGLETARHPLSRTR